MDVFALYRPVVPDPRAQSVQVVSSAHALAGLGHRVELWAEGSGRPETVLAAYGLSPVPDLALRVVAGRTAASLAFRAGFWAWFARTRGRGIVLARHPRHADRVSSVVGRRLRLVLEVHEVARHEMGRADDVRGRDHAIESRVVRAGWGVIANAPGTLALLQRAHEVLPPAVVIHNAGRRPARPGSGGGGVGIVGSVRPYKDPETVAAAALRMDVPITWVGADAQAATRLAAVSGGRVVPRPPVPYAEVPALLGRFDALVVPLSPGVFGEALTSPLKLWDALLSGVPIVAADTEAVRAAAGDAFVPYTPGDPASLAAAVARAREPAVRARVLAAAAARARTWEQRAREVAAFLAPRAG